MPSLTECVLSELENADLDAPADDPILLFANLDLDADAIAAVEGSWEILDIGDRAHPITDELTPDRFTPEGPSVYLADELMIVRGREDTHHVYFAFQRTH